MNIHIKKNVHFLLLIGLLGAFFSATYADEPTSSSANVIHTGIVLQDGSYRLGAGDELQFNVLNEPEYMVQKALVQPDGKLSLPEIGILDVGGITVSEVITNIEEKLSRTIIHPKVNLTLLHTRPASVYLSGALMKPGMLQINTNGGQQSISITPSNDLASRVDLKLSNILALAGGVSLNADLTNIEIRHIKLGTVEHVDFWKLLHGLDTTQDILLNDGDSVYIPETPVITLNDEDFKTMLRSSIGPKTFPVRVVGQVKTPGVYMLDATSPNLITAISNANDFAIQASHQKVLIQRLSGPDHLSNIFVSPDKFDICLRPNDIIRVEENKVYKSGRFMQQVSYILSPFQVAGIAASSTAQVFGLGGWNRKIQTTAITNTTATGSVTNTTAK